MMINAAEQARGNPMYIFAIEDRSAPSDQDTGTMYFFMTGLFGLEVGDRIAACDIQPGAPALAFEMRGRRDGSIGRLQARAIRRDNDSLLRSICRGLALPLSSLRENAPRRSGTTVYDFLARGRNGLGLLLVPAQGMGQDLEAGILRQYWVSALAARYSRLTGPDVFGDADLFDKLGALMEGDWVEFDMPLPAGLSNPSEYPARARSEFGTRVDRLDADWSDYLSGATVTVRNEQRAAVRNGRVAPLVPRFSLAEVGTPPFWLAANDVRALLEQSNCLAQHFLTAREYVSPEETPYTGQCPIGEIRLPGR